MSPSASPSPSPPASPPLPTLDLPPSSPALSSTSSDPDDTFQDALTPGLLSGAPSIAPSPGTSINGDERDSPKHQPEPGNGQLNVGEQTLDSHAAEEHGDEDKDDGSAYGEEEDEQPPPTPSKDEFEAKPSVPEGTSLLPASPPLASVPDSLARTATPVLASLPRSVLPTPPSRPRPISVLSLSSLEINRTVASNPNRLSLSYNDDDDLFVSSEAADGLSALSKSTSSSHPPTPRRPFSLSSDPETPTTPSSGTTAASTLRDPTLRSNPSSPANSRRRSLLLSHSHGPPDPTAVGRENSPSLTEAVWRQSMGLSGNGLASPLGTPTREYKGMDFGFGFDEEGDKEKGKEEEDDEAAKKGGDFAEVKLDDEVAKSSEKGLAEGEGEELEGNHTPREASSTGVFASNGFSHDAETAKSRLSEHRRSISDSALLEGASFPSSSSDEEDEDADPSEARDSFASSSSALTPSFPSSSSIASRRDVRQPSIATPHAADGFLSHRASATLSSLSQPVGPDNPPSGFTNREIKASFEAVRRREESEGGVQGEGGGEGEVDWDFWGRVMNDYEEVARTQPRELSRAIQKGIPQALRGMTWQLMAAAKDANLEFIYSELLKQSSSHEKSIARDLNRTFPKHEYFKESAEDGGVGQENLFNVVKAYSLYDDEVGYTQGLQFIVGPLLLNMPDEEAFCVLVRLMKAYDLRSHYTPNMPGLQLRLFQFDRLVEELLPGVFLHMLRQGVKSSMYASQWFLTLFGYRFPLELVSSVFDLVFAEGVEAVFRFAVALLKRNEDVLCTLEFEDLIEFLKNGLFEGYAPSQEEREANPDALYKVNEFIRDALQIRITPLMLDQFGEEWSHLCAQQTAHTVELDTLRKANLQLSLQVRQLEGSLAQVNQEHCELVKQVVASRIEREELEDELVKYKLAYADLSHSNAMNAASMSPLQGRRQSEMSIASSFGGDDSASVSSSASQSGNTSSTSVGGSALAGLAGAGRWFGMGGGGSSASNGKGATSSAMSHRSLSNRSDV